MYRSYRLLGILFSKDIMIDDSQKEEEDVFDDTVIGAPKDKSEED